MSKYKVDSVVKFDEGGELGWKGTAKIRGPGKFAAQGCLYDVELITLEDAFGDNIFDPEEVDYCLFENEIVGLAKN